MRHGFEDSEDFEEALGGVKWRLRGFEDFEDFGLNIVFINLSFFLRISVRDIAIFTPSLNILKIIKNQEAAV